MSLSMDSMSVKWTATQLDRKFEKPSNVPLMGDCDSDSSIPISRKEPINQWLNNGNVNFDLIPKLPNPDSNRSNGPMHQLHPLPLELFCCCCWFRLFRSFAVANCRCFELFVWKKFSFIFLVKKSNKNENKKPKEKNLFLKLSGRYAISEWSFIPIDIISNESMTFFIFISIQFRCRHPFQFVSIHSFRFIHSDRR